MTCENEAYTIHPSFSIAKDLIAKKMVRENALLLSVCAQFNDPMAKSMMQWLSDTTVINYKDDESKIVELFNSHLTNPKNAQLIFTLH